MTMTETHCESSAAWINVALESRDAEQVFSTLRDEVLSLDLLQVASHLVHRVPTYFFRVSHIPSGNEVGRVNLRASMDPHIRFHAGHVGYEIHHNSRGHRYASRALTLLKPLARQLGMDPISITCDPDNIPSRRSCEIAGATLVHVLDLPEDCVIHRNGHPRKCLYHLPA
jgi:predicted acetyltransferase